MKKILLSVATLVIVGVAVVGATTAIFSDTEVSTGNTFTAGAIDLTVDNESYYNGVFNEGTSWLKRDLVDGDWFFHFEDLKPGDWGEDTISLYVNNNDSWLCADVTLTSNQDNGSTEPEEIDENPWIAGRGELGDRINFIAWADDGDNVLEDNEYVYELGTLGALGIGETVTAPLADASWNVWEREINTPLDGDKDYYIGKAWCFGDLDINASTYAQDGKGAEDGNSGPDERPIFCDGSGEDNSTQTDGLTADISFRSVQSRNNAGFVCEGTDPVDATLTVDKRITFTSDQVDVEISDFTLTVSGPGGPYIVTDEVPLTGLADGLYTVTEVKTGGAGVIVDAEFDIDCSDLGDSGTVTLSAGDNKTCRITNEIGPS